MDFSVLWIVGGVLLLAFAIMFLTLVWSTLEAAREFYQRENRKHR